MVKKTNINKEKIINMISAYGANSKNWPDELKNLMQTETKINVEIQKTLADANQIDKELLEYKIPTNGSIDDLRDKIIKIAKITPQTREEKSYRKENKKSFTQYIWDKIPSIPVLAPSGGIVTVVLLAFWVNIGTINTNTQQLDIISDIPLAELAIYDELLQDNIDDEDLIWYIMEDISAE